MAERDDAGVRFPPPLMFIGFLLAGLAIGAFIDRPGLGLPTAVRVVAGGAILFAALALIGLAGGAFRAAGTRPEPWKPTSAIVASGAYGFTRNPMYLGMAAAYLGLALLCDSLAALALLPVAVWVAQTQVIAKEERYLEAKFGEAYLAYKRRVRRWI